MIHTLEQGSFREQEYIPLDDPQTYWYSYDLGCCTALLCVGYKLVSLDRTIPRKVQFIIKRDNNLDQIAESYWSNQLQVSAREYFDTLRMLKNRLHSEEGGPR